MLLGVPKKLKPGMPVIRSFLSKSLNFGAMVRDLISLNLRREGSERRPSSRGAQLRGEARVPAGPEELPQASAAVPREGERERGRCTALIGRRV